MSFEIDRSRRHALASLSALSLAGLSPLRAFAETKLTVGVIYVGPKDDYGYNQSQVNGAAGNREGNDHPKGNSSSDVRCF